jgi:predicted HTH transcriptional regulator
MFHKRSKKLGELNGYAEEMLTGCRTIQAYAREEEISGRFNKRNTDSMDAYYNADYYGSRGIVIIKAKNGITISNPGGFRIGVDEAKSGGISDPRNTTLIKMFNLINIGERAGSGIPNIFNVWKKQGWQEPEIQEGFEPPRISIALPLEKSDSKKAAEKSGGKKAAVKSGGKKLSAKTIEHRNAIIDYLTINVIAGRSELAELLGLKDSRVKVILSEMVADKIIVAEGDFKNRVYRLKENAGE